MKEPVSLIVTIADQVTRNIPNIPWTADMTVQLAMERAYALDRIQQTPQPLSFTLRYFGPTLGYLIQSVDDNADEAPDTKPAPRFWFIFVNNTLSKFGIDWELLDPGDVLELKYETYSEAVHGGTIYTLKAAGST